METKHVILPFWCAAITAAALPIGNYDMENFLATTLLLSISALATLLVASERKPPLSIPKTLILPLGLAFWVLAFISVLLSEAKFHSFFFFIFFSTFPVSVIVLFTAFRMKVISLEPLVIFGAIAACALCANAFIQYFFFQDSIKFGRPHLPLANPNSMAGLISLFIFGAFGTFLACKNTAEKSTALIITILLFAAFVTIGSRGAFIAMLGGGGVMGILLFPELRTHWKYIAGLLILCALVFIGFELYDPTNTIGKNLLNVKAGNISNAWHRGDLWASALAMARDHLWHGTGIGTFPLYYEEYRQHDVKSAGLTAHNDPLQFAIEMGILAPILFYAFIITAIAVTFRALKAIPKESTKERIILVTSFCALGAFIAHTHITYHLNVLVLLMAAGAAIAIWLHTVLEATQPQSITVKQPKALLIILTALLALSMVIFTPLQLGNIYARKAGEAQKANQLQEMIHYINKADKVTAQHNSKALILAAQISLSTLKLDNGAFSKQHRLNTFNHAMELLERAENINPRKRTIYSTRAMLYTQMGDMKKAKAEWAKFREIIWQYSE